MFLLDSTFLGIQPKLPITNVRSFLTVKGDRKSNFQRLMLPKAGFDCGKEKTVGQPRITSAVTNMLEVVDMFSTTL